MKKAFSKGTLSLDILGISEPIKTKNIDYRSENSFTWTGAFDKGDAFLTHENGRTYGQIRNNGAVFDIQYLENGYAALIEYDMEKLNKIGCAIPNEYRKKEINKSSLKQEYEGNKPTAQQSAAGGGAFSNVRALVLFTPAAQATGMNMTDLANIARTQWQNTQSNSNGSSDLEIAGVQLLNFIENGGNNNIFQDVNALRDDINAQQLRNQFEADIVILLTDGIYPGIGGIVADIGPIDNDAYAIAQVANATSTFTFIHEAAHLFGARHEFPADDTPGDAHGHGWTKTTGSWWWKEYYHYSSIMHRQQFDRTRVSHFSNPFVAHEGQATGVTGTSNNTIIINDNGQIVCDFRFTQPDMSVFINGPSSADNYNLLFFSSSISNGTAPYTYQWQAKTTGQYINVGSNSSTLSYTMPVDIDLQLLLTVTDANSEQAVGYKMVQNLFSGGGGPCNNCPDNTLLDYAVVQDDKVNAKDEFFELLLFPNPSSNQLRIVSPKKVDNNSKFQIVDLNGAIIIEDMINTNAKPNPQSLTIDISRLKSGMYLLKIISEGTIQSMKFIKE